MRVSQVFFRQNIGWHFNKHWIIQGKKKVCSSPAEKILRARGISVEDPNEFLREKIKPEKVEVIGWKGALKKEIVTKGPNFHEKPLLTCYDNNLLLEGLSQAKYLTNTVEIQEGLPEKYRVDDISRELNRRVKKIVFGSNLFDAQQIKLHEKIKDPNRPAFNFPRVYGITQNRIFKLFITKLLNAIETTSELDLVKQRYLADNLYFSYPFKRDEDLIQFQFLGDFVLLSEKPLSPITSENLNAIDLPDLYPIKPTITLNSTNDYVLENIYPVNKNAPKYHPHTLFINYDKEHVKNLYEEEVTEQQISGRTLLKTFTAAAAYAKQRFGEDVKELPSPVTLQAVQTDGKMFYFGVLQLNTLDLNSSEIRNVWYQTPPLSLFDKCAYELGKPVLEGYDRSVINNFVKFYNNV